MIHSCHPSALILYGVTKVAQSITIDHVELKCDMGCQSYEYKYNIGAAQIVDLFPIFAQ